MPVKLQKAIKSQMDFIGFKCDSNTLSTSSQTDIDFVPDLWTGYWGGHAVASNSMSEFDYAKVILKSDAMKKLGYNLQQVDYALDQSAAYFGIYSLQEMNTYKNVNRYVTFVEVEKSKFYYKTNDKTKQILGGLFGGFAAGGGIFMLGGAAVSSLNEDLTGVMCGVGGGLIGLGSIFGIIALTPTKTDILFDGVYNIYVYDTQTKQLIRKDSVSVKLNDTFKGSFTYNDASKNVVYDYIAQNIKKDILTKYEEVTKWLSQRSE